MFAGGGGGLERGEGAGAKYNRIRWSCKTIPEDVITKVVQAALRWEDHAFFEVAASSHNGNLSLDVFEWAMRQLASIAREKQRVKD